MAKLNKHQKNSLEAITEKLERLGEVEAVKLVKAVMENDHNGMLDNDVYWIRHERIYKGS